MSKKKIYISLPITGRDFDEVESEILYVSGVLEREGYHVVTPIDFDVNPDLDKPYHELLGNDIKALMECDEICLCPGWEKSKGCQLEHFAAKLWDKEIMEFEKLKNKEDMEEKKLNYEELKHYYDSTCGLWVIDRNPKEVTHEWIVENAFQLGDTTYEKVCVSNLKPFDLEAAKVGKPVCTRGGKKARIICWDKKGSAPIVALIEHEDSEFDLSYHNNGSYMSEGESGNDLMMLTKKKEGWLNIFKDFEDTVCCVYPTEKEALEDGETEKDYITTIKIEWEE